MTQGQYIINRKLNIMELGATLGKISDACCKLGISRQPNYCESYKCAASLLVYLIKCQ